MIPSIGFTVTDIRFSSTSFENISTPFFQINNIESELSLQKDNQYQLTLFTKNITSKLFGEIKSAEFICDELVLTNEHVECVSGKALLQHPIASKAWNISFSINNKTGNQTFNLQNNNFADGQIEMTAIKSTATWNLTIQLNAVDLNLIRQIATPFMPELENYQINSGKITAAINSYWLNNIHQKSDINYSISNLSLDSEQVLEQVDFSGVVKLQETANHLNVKNTMHFRSGAMYLTPGFDVFDSLPGFYLDLNEQNISIENDCVFNKTEQQLTINALHYHHGDLLQINGTGHINFKPEVSIPDSDINVVVNNLEQTYPVYIQPILLPTNYADLDVAGKMKIHLIHEQGELEKLELDLDDIFIDDERQRFGIAGFNSQIDMENTNNPVSSTIHWDSISIYKLLLGPADMEFTSQGNHFQVNKWKNVEILDGEIEIENLVVQQLGEQDFSFALSGHLKPMTLASFTSTMGWPAMSGTIGGEVSGLSYQNNHLEIDGDILFSVFDGSIRLSDFYIDDLFSSYSRLHTNIQVDKIDLEQLTNTFTFGKIEGTLNGYLKDFTLENWQPVAFDAAFSTPENDQKPHRISQKALDNISELGGGITGALSKGFLSFIPEYSYGQLGLKCRLDKNICHLGGVKDTDSGFYILTRGGLLPPWVDVKGTGRSIDWQNLIDGLKQIAEGELSIQ